jgi:hypothetical protein
MAANTRYQPAPQRDSFDERPYNPAPPSYEATAEGPRTEDDNVPDDFKVCGRLFLKIGSGLILTIYSVRRHGLGGYSSHPYAVHPQGLLHPVSDLKTGILLPTRAVVDISFFH